MTEPVSVYRISSAFLAQLRVRNTMIAVVLPLVLILLGNDETPLRDLSANPLFWAAIAVLALTLVIVIWISNRLVRRHWAGLEARLTPDTLTVTSRTRERELPWHSIKGMHVTRDAKGKPSMIRLKASSGGMGLIGLERMAELAAEIEGHLPASCKVTSRYAWFDVNRPLPFLILLILASIATTLALNGIEGLPTLRHLPLSQLLSGALQVVLGLAFVLFRVASNSNPGMRRYELIVGGVLLLTGTLHLVEAGSSHDWLP